MWTGEGESQRPTEGCVLVASPDASLAETARAELGRRGFEVVFATDAREAALQLTAARTVDAVLVDMSAFTDIAFLQAVRESPARPEIIALADEAGLAAELAAQAGADVCHHPTNWSLAEERLRRALCARSMREQLERAAAADTTVVSAAAVGPEHEDLVFRHRRAAQTAIPLVIAGPPGTPRLGVAKLLHENSGRAHRPFLSLQATAFSPEDLHRALFGESGTAGAFENAAGGSVHVDEIEALSPRSQAALARVLESRAVLRAGKDHAVDARLLSSTTVDLRARVEQGLFRADLLYRLAGISLKLSPLVERPTEIDQLCDGLLSLLDHRHTRRLSSAARQSLVEYAWPGNEHELELVLRRALLCCYETTLEPEHFFLHRGGALQAEESARVLSFEEYEGQAMNAALDQTGGNVTKAARVLGIGRATFYRKAKKFGIAL